MSSDEVEHFDMSPQVVRVLSATGDLSKMHRQNPYQAAKEFAQLFSQFEYALKRSGHLREGKDHAEADWESYARELGADFFKSVAASGIADTLLNDPPRKLMRDGLSWEPLRPAPLKDVQELIVRGVCRVRNSYVHGEKFVAGDNWERDSTLVCEALKVLQMALAQIPISKD